MSIDELLAGYLSEDLSPSDLAELEKRLSTDPAARARLAELCQRELALRDVLSATAAVRPMRRRRPVERRPASGWLAALVAAGLAVAFVAIVGSTASRREAPAPPPRIAERTPEAPPPAPAPEAPKPEPPRQLPPTPVLEPVRTPPPPPPVPREEPKPVPPPIVQPRDTVAQAKPSLGVERVRGEARSGAEALRAGDRLPLGRAVETSGAGSSVALQLEDGTRIELAGNTRVEPADGRVTLASGALTATVARQAAGRMMVFTTPHAEARVLGTALRLSVEGDSTRLDVIEGKVRLVRTSDQKGVDVAGGQFAIAARGVALLTRPIPEEPKTLFFEVEELGTARGVKPADGMVRRPFLEPFDTAAGGWCLSVPASGMDVTADVRLAKGTWQLWVRYRDEPGNTKVTFDVLAGGQLLGSAATPGKSRGWNWKRFTFPCAGGTVRFSLRSTYEGVKAAADAADFRQSPYGALNRWDRVCLTPDESFTPE